MKAEWNVIKITIHRYKVVYGFTAGYLVFLILCGLLTTMDSSGAVAISVFYFLGLTACIGAFGHPEADLAVDRPALPPFLLRLPISTPSLALPPAIGSASVGFFGWMAYVKLFLEPVLAHTTTGALPNLYWPAPMLAALGPMLLALQWAPLTGKSRVLAIIALPSLLIVGGIIWGISTAGGGLALFLFFTVVAVLSTLGAWGALGASRTNGGASWTIRLRRNVKLRDRRREMPDFRSPLAAQRWLEWHRQSKYLPIATGAVLTMLSLMLLIPQTYGPVTGLPDLYLRVDVTSLAPAVLWIPVLFAIVFGLGARRSEARGAEGLYSPFFSTRPADSALLLRAKAQAGLLAAGAAWGLSIGALFLWSLLPGYIQKMPMQLATATPASSAGTQLSGRMPVQAIVDPPVWGRGLALILETATTQQVMSAIAFGLLTLFLTWRCQAVGVVADCLAGRRASLRYGIISISASAVAFMLFSMDSNQFLRDGSPGRIALFVGFLAVKLVLWFAVAYSFLGRRPNGGKEVVRNFAQWVTASVLLTAVFSFFGGAAMIADWHWAAMPELFVAAAALTPLARPLMARNAIEAGRHA